jgi:hypothetical protein
MVQGTMVLKHEKVNLHNIATDVVSLCQPLVAAPPQRAPRSDFPRCAPCPALQ